jgi:hypothetical protein
VETEKVRNTAIGKQGLEHVVYTHPEEIVPDHHHKDRMREVQHRHNIEYVDQPLRSTLKYLIKLTKARTLTVTVLQQAWVSGSCHQPAGFVISNW